MNKLYEAIRSISNFGELCASDLALLVYPDIDFSEASRRTLIRRVISSLKKSGYVKFKKLSSGADLFYLSRSGSNLANQIGCEFSKPNLTNETSSAWKHDSYAAQMIYAITGGNPDNFITEHQLISEYGVIDDRPDGVVKFRDQWYLLEIENARKSGQNMRNQVNRIKKSLNGYYKFDEINIIGSIICYPSNFEGINHRTRLINALHQDKDIDDRNIDLILVGFKVKNVTHARIDFISEINEIKLSKLKIEFGLPSKVRTGQIIRKKRKFSHYDIDLMRDDLYDPSCYFIIENLKVNILAELDENDVYKVIATINSEHAFSHSYTPKVSISSAIDDVLITLKRIRQDENGQFLSPRFSYQ